MSERWTYKTVEEPTCRLQIRNGVLQQRWLITKWWRCIDIERIVEQAEEWRDVPQVTE